LIKGIVIGFLLTFALYVQGDSPEVPACTIHPSVSAVCTVTYVNGKGLYRFECVGKDGNTYIMYAPKGGGAV